MNKNILSQNYTTIKKYLSVHSSDRDLCKWPSSSKFEISLPIAYHNISSAKLNSFTLPNSTNLYNFDSCLNNINLTFKIENITNLQNEFTTNSNYVEAALKNSLVSGVEINLSQSPNAKDSYSVDKNGTYTIQIQEGFYTTSHLQNEIQNKMNLAVNNKLIELGWGMDIPYTGFGIFYDSVAKKFIFGNTEDNFSFIFAEHLEHSECCNSKVGIKKDVPNYPFCNSTGWGLGYNLGFFKKNYSSTEVTSEDQISFYWNDDVIWTINGIEPKYILTPPQILVMQNNKIMYLEIKYLNCMDTTSVCTSQTDNMYNQHGGGGVHDAAFAVIPLETSNNSWISDTALASAIKYFDSPLERLQKLDFTFKYHDGSLVNFRNFSIHFIIEFDILVPTMNNSNMERLITKYI